MERQTRRRWERLNFAKRWRRNSLPNIAVSVLSRVKGTKRLFAIEYAPLTIVTVTLVQRQHHEVHEGAFKDWGYQLAREELAELIDGGPWLKVKTWIRKEIVIKDGIADIPQQIRCVRLNMMLSPSNADYISDALAAQVGIVVAPGKHRWRMPVWSHHGNAPKYAGWLCKLRSIILRWDDAGLAADLIG